MSTRRERRRGEEEEKENGERTVWTSLPETIAVLSNPMHRCVGDEDNLGDEAKRRGKL